MPRIIRSQDPPRLLKYKKYKPFLRIDFLRRCAYCHIPELRFGGARNFAVEHFRPKKIFPHLISEYSNLYYACNTCNDFKGARWPRPSEHNRGHSFVDPCETSMAEHIAIDSSGISRPRTPAGRYTAAHLNLDREFLKLWRGARQQLRQRLSEIEDEITALEADSHVHQHPRAQALLAALRQMSGHLRADLQAEYADWWE
jgi:hypothetical protein